MKVFLILTIIFFGNLAAAKDDWLCTEASSLRELNDIRSCGIGIGKDEAEARLKAFDSAKAEFNKVCDSSDDCKDHELSVDPKRTTCSQTGSTFKCYRLIVFSIQSAMKPEIVVEPKQSGILEKKSTRRLPETAPVEVLSVADDNGDVRKLKKGLKKSQVIAMFGTPSSADKDYEGKTSFFYVDNEICHYEYCHVYFSAAGKVESWSEFKPELTSDLDDEATPAKAVKQKRNVANKKTSPSSRVMFDDLVPDAP